MHFEEPDLKVKIVDDGDDDGMAEKLYMSTQAGANEFGSHGDKMPLTPERELPAYPEPDITFSSLTAIEKYVVGKAMLGSDISECIAPAELRKIATSVGHLLDVDITEVFSPEGVAKLCKKHVLTPGCSLVLTNGHDFNKAADRERAWEIIKRDKPHTVIGSPPCTYFSALQELNKCLYKDDPVWMDQYDNNPRKAKQHVQCFDFYLPTPSRGQEILSTLNSGAVEQLELRLHYGSREDAWS